MEKNNEHNDKQAVSKAVAHEMETVDTIFATEYIAPPPLFLASDPKHIKEEVENEDKDEKFSPAEITDQSDQKNSPDPVGADLKSDTQIVKANAPVKEDEKEEEIMDGPSADLVFADDSPEPPNEEDEEENGAAAGGSGGSGDDDSPIQNKEGNPSAAAGNTATDSVVPAEVMSKMETSMGADFSNVEINTNSSQAKENGALAFAQGNKVHFAPGQFNPSTTEGQQLLGHELAHVKQQREGKVKPTTSVNGMSVNDDPKLEKAADIEGEKAAKLDVPTTQKKEASKTSNNDSPIQKQVVQNSSDTAQLQEGPRTTPSLSDESIPDTMSLVYYITDEMNTNVIGPDVARISSYPFYQRPLALLEFASLVRGGAIWDHKPAILAAFGQWSRDEESGYDFFFDIWSNIHYGYIGKAAGFSEFELLQAPGAAQVADGTVPDDFDLREGLAGLDDPLDQFAIKLGFRLWDTHGNHLSYDDVIELVRANKSSLSTRSISSQFGNTPAQEKRIESANDLSSSNSEDVIPSNSNQPIQRNGDGSEDSETSNVVEIPFEITDSNICNVVALGLFQFKNHLDSLVREIENDEDYNGNVEELQHSADEYTEVIRSLSERGEEVLANGEIVILQLFINGSKETYDSVFRGYKSYLNRHTESLRRVRRLDAMTPELAEAKRQAFENGDESMLERIKGVVDSVKDYNEKVSTYIERASRIHNGIRNSETIQGIRTAAGRIADLADKAGQVLNAMTIVANFATDSSNSELHESINDVQNGLDAIDFGLSFVKAVPVFGALWSNYYYPAATACLRMIGQIATARNRDRRLITWISSNWNSSTPPTLQRGLSIAFPGDQAVFSFMWHIFFGSYVHSDAAETYFVDHDSEFNAGTSVELTTERHGFLWLNRRATNLEFWATQCKRDIWLMLYGADLPFPGHSTASQSIRDYNDSVQMYVGEPLQLKPENGDTIPDVIGSKLESKIGINLPDLSVKDETNTLSGLGAKAYSFGSSTIFSDNQDDNMHTSVHEAAHSIQQISGHQNGQEKQGTLKNEDELSAAAIELSNKIIQKKEDPITQNKDNETIQKFDWTFGIGDAINDYKQDHYNRNQYNQAPQQEPVDDPNWRRLPDSQSIYHQNGENGAGNRKYVSVDGGNFEAVYDANGQLVTDDANMGTYNHSGPDDAMGHFIDDVVPYWMFGNNENDDTPLVNRIAGPRILERTGNAIGDGVDAAGDFLGGVWNATGGQLFGGSDDTTQQKSEEDIQMKMDPAQLMIGDEEEEEIQMKSEIGQLKENASIDPDLKAPPLQRKDEGQNKSESNHSTAQLKVSDIIPSGVNIHTESSKATEMGALAFAQGTDIHFAPGQFKPDTRAGQELIGHELGHIVQQKEGRVKPTTQLKGVNVNDDKGLEKEADDFGVKFANSLQNKTQTPVQNKVESGFSLSSPAIQKKENPNPTAPLQMKADAGAAGAGGGTSEGSGPISINGSQTGVKDLMSSSPLPLFEKIKTTPSNINASMSAESTELKSSFPNIEQPTGIENQPIPETGEQNTVPITNPGDIPTSNVRPGGSAESSDPSLAPASLGPNTDGPTSQVSAMPPSPVPTVNAAPPSSTNITIGEDTVDYSAGTRPEVDTSGDADPGQMTTQETSDTSKVQGELSTANLEIGKDHGENDIYPHYAELEQLTPQVEIPQGQQIPIPEMEELSERRAEVDAAFNLHAQPKLNEDIAQHVQKNEEEVNKMNQGSQEEWTNYESSMTAEEARVKAEQETAQRNAQAEVETQKQNWQTENDAVKEKFVSDASAAKAEYQGKIDTEISTADSSVEATLTQAEIDAQKEADLAQADADQKEREAEEKKSGGFFGWLADKVSKALDWLKDRFNEIIDALKAAVDVIIDLAKKAANAIIEAARRAITGLIRAFGEILKTFVDIAFAAFPEIRDRIKNVIDTTVNTAVEVVNTLADGLKDFVNALLDALGSALKFLLDAYQAYINFLIDAIKFITVGLFKIFQFITNLVIGAWKAPPQFFGCLAEDALGGNPGEPLKDIEVPNGQEEQWARAMGISQETGEGISDEGELTDQIQELLTKGELSEGDVSLEPSPAVELNEQLLSQLAMMQDGEVMDLGGAGGNSVTTEEFQASAADAAGYDLTSIDPSLLEGENLPLEEGATTEGSGPDFKNMSDEAKLQYYLDQMLPETQQVASEQPAPGAAGKEASNSDTSDAALIAKTGRLGVGQRLAFMGKQMITGMKVFWNTYKAWIIGGLVTALIAAGAIAFFTGGAGLALAVDIILKAMIVIFGAVAIFKASGHVWDYVKHAWAGNTDAAGKSLAMACAVLVNEFLIDKILMGMGKVFRRTMKAIKASRVGRAAARVTKIVRKGTQGGSNVVKRGISAIKNSRLVVKMKGVVGRGVNSFMDLRRRILERFGFDKLWFEKVNKYVELWASFNPRILLMRVNTDTDQIEVEDIDAVAPNTSNLTPKTGDTLPNGTTMGTERIGRSSTALDADGASSVIVSDDFMRRINDPSLSPADRQAILQELKARVDAGDYHAIREFVEAQGALKFNREEFLEMFPGQEKVADAIEARHQLRSNMGDLPDLDIPYEAHHLIPVEVLKSTDADGILMRMAIEGGFDFNSALNGRWAAKYSESLGLGGIHASHPQYTSQIQLAIQKRAAQLDIDEITADIAREEIEKILKEIQYAFDNNLQLENPIKLNDLDLDLTSTPVRGVSRNAFLNSAEQLAKDPVFGNEMYDLWVKQDWAEIERIFTERAIKYPPNQGFVDITEVTLKVDTVIDRYGGFIDDAGDFQDYGRFVAPDSAPFDSRALPDDSLSKPYRRYRVVKEIPSVGAGQAIPWFGKPGLGTQYLFQKSINELLEEGFIELLD